MARINTRIIIKHDTTENWNNAVGFIPLKGEVIIYEDYTDLDGTVRPNVKVGDGTTYVQDLPFLAEIPEEITDHINNNLIHVTAEEKALWNHKIDCYDTILEEELILYR